MTSHAAEPQPQTHTGWWKPLAALLLGAALLVALAMYFQGVLAQGLRHCGAGWAFLIVLAWSFAAMKLLTWGVDNIVTSLRASSPEKA
jgi:hypothetical protein